MQFFLLRHGESEGPLYNCYVGAADFGLSELGREQAELLGAAVARLSVQAVFCSPLKRSLHTAEIIQQRMAIPCKLEIEETLRERNSYGILSGVEKKLAGFVFRDIIDNLDGPPEFTRKQIPGSEPIDSFTERVRLCFEFIVRQCEEKEYESAVIVGHGKFLEVLLLEVLKACDSFDYTFGKIFRLQYSPAAVAFQKMTF